MVSYIDKSKLLKQIHYYASIKQTPVSLRQMVKFGHSPNAGTLLQASQFVREELPVRLAHRVVELEEAPYGLSEMPSVQLVRDWYMQSFHDLISFPTPEEFGIDTGFINSNNGSSATRNANIKDVPSELFIERPLQPAAPFLTSQAGFESGITNRNNNNAMWKMLFGQNKENRALESSANIKSKASPDAIWNAESKAPAFIRNNEISFITAASATPIKLSSNDHDASLKLDNNAQDKIANSLAFSKKFKQYYIPVKATNFSTKVIEYNRKFVECIEKVKTRHDPTMSTMALGVLEAKEYWEKADHPLHKAALEVEDEYVRSGSAVPLPIKLQHFLDRFYMSRIGIRMLIGQHIALLRDHDDKFSRAGGKDYVGIICTKTKLHQVAHEAMENARAVCQNHYGLFHSPNIRFIGSSKTEFMYVPSHLHHMLFELLKNSLRAVVERFGVEYDEWPEIKLVAAEGKEDITLKISDEGGGIPRSGMPLVWTYMYTTANKPLINQHELKNDYKAPLAGFGYGLPLARLYARYFGGDLRLISMESYGTDAYLHLNRLSDSEEPLP